MAGPRTLGVEEELHVVDLATGKLSAQAARLLRGLPGDAFSAELQRTTVETNTEPCETLTELRAEIIRLRRLVDEVAAADGLGVMSSGSAPFSDRLDFELTTQGRFGQMQQNYRALVDDQLICGLQVHAALPDRDVAVRIAQRLATDLPTLLAISASSPFWHGTDTGYASFRTMVWQRWPSAGSFGPIAYASEYDRLVNDLIQTGVISDAKMAYFDVRPSAHVPTVELRVCDACPVVDDAVLIAALFRALVDDAVRADERGDPMHPRREPVHRAAMWQAARRGLAGPLLGPDPAPTPAPGAEVVQDLVRRLREPLEANRDWEDVAELTEALLGRGDSSRRQRERFAQRGKLSDVVALVVEETRGRTAYPIRRVELTADYDGAANDEALTLAGMPHPAYRAVVAALDELGTDELRERTEKARAVGVQQGLTFGVDGEHQEFPVDLVPRIITAHEWSILAAGLTQRARAIELFLRDVYGPGEIFDDGLIDRATVESGPGWSPAARLLPAESLRAPIIGFDLVRDEVGGWRVLEDNARVPSGIAYAIGMRNLSEIAVPELAAGLHLRDPRTAFALISDTLRAIAGGAEPIVALLSDGADNSAWYEHRMIAHGCGFLLVQPDEVSVEPGRVVAGGRRIDLVYLRLGVELADLRDSGGRPIGARILAAAQAGIVRLANAPGTGVADDKAMYCQVPEFVSYYLGERPLLSPVPTYRCANPAERDLVLGRLVELVTKPVDGYGGTGVLIGSSATAEELRARRAEIEQAPDYWIAQEIIALSTHPVMGPQRLEPRHVDLRAFVLLSGTAPDEVHLADLALTRVAPMGSMVVNSSRGGGAKDTWVLADPDSASDSDPDGR